MDILVINREEVKSLLSMKDCIELVAKAHQLLSDGMAELPLRTAIFPKHVHGLLATMPAYLGGDDPVLGLKTVTVFHDNHEKGIESHQANISLLEPDTGRLMALIDGAEITAMRTAAASAVATRILAREDADHLALLGTGVQAHSHLSAISEVCDLKQVSVWNRSSDNAEKFGKSAKTDLPITSHNTVKEAVKNADIICTLTASSVPILENDWVKPGTHINAVGSATPNARELSGELVAGSSIFVDVVESALHEAGDLIIPFNEGLLGDKLEEKIISDLGDLVSKKHEGRISRDEITLYKSLGVGIQDLVTANYVMKKAKKSNIGKFITLE